MWKARDVRNLIPVLAYHEISDRIELDKKIRSMQPAYCILRSKFEDQMKLIASCDFQTLISPEEAVGGKDLEAYKETKNIIITFDDGHEGNYQVAYPILKKYGLRSVFFVTVNFIESNKMMDWEQLKEMSQSGMSIQSHAMTHAPLETLSKKEIVIELEQSRKIIELNIGQKVDSISLPHGSINQEIYHLARQAGYRHIYGSSVGYLKKNCKAYKRIIPRIPIVEKYSFEKFNELIEIDILYTAKKNVYRELRLMVKKIIGINNYRKLYRMFFKIRLEG